VKWSLIRRVNIKLITIRATCAWQQGIIRS
jgi:hypothetical protein